MDSVHAAVRLWKSPRVWTAIGMLGAALPVVFTGALRVARWANERASVTELRAVQLELARVTTVEQTLETQRLQQIAAIRELAAGWAWERVAPERRGAVVTEQQRDAAAERARGHFDRLLLRGYDAPEALRVALRQIDAAR